MLNILRTDEKLKSRFRITFILSYLISVRDSDSQHQILYWDYCQRRYYIICTQEKMLMICILCFWQHRRHIKSRYVYYKEFCMKCGISFVISRCLAYFTFTLQIDKMGCTYLHENVFFHNCIQYVSVNINSSFSSFIFIYHSL